MSRKHQAKIREVLPDPVYNDKMITKFVNALMYDGKKAKAEGIFYKALKIIEERNPGEEGYEVFKRAMNQIKPALEVRSRRIGGATYQVPSEVRPFRRQSLAIRWIRDYARLRPGKSMEEKLAEEIFEAANSRGGAFKKKEDVYKMAESNKAFAHLKW